MSSSLIADRPAASTRESLAGRRARPRPAWRDPRMAAGVGLVAASVVTGSLLLDRTEDRTAVLAAVVPLVAGQSVESDDVATVLIGLDDVSTGGAYLPAETDLTGLVVVRTVEPGELVPRAALGDTTVTLSQVPLAVSVDLVPSSVRVGSVVDVYSTSVSAGRVPARDGVGGVSPAELLLEAVPVLSLGAEGDGLGSAPVVQVVVGVDAEQRGQLGRVLTGTADSAAVVVMRGNVEGPSS